MIGKGSDLLLYLYEHKSEEEYKVISREVYGGEDEYEYSFFVEDIALEEIQKYIGKFETDLSDWTEDMFHESTKKRVDWNRVMSFPDDLVSYKDQYYLLKILVADEQSDYKEINTTLDYLKPTVLLEKSMPSFIQCIEKYRELVNAMPTDPIAFEPSKDADLFTKEELHAQFDKLDYFIEMMKTGKYSIVSFGI